MALLPRCEVVTRGRGTHGSHLQQQLHHIHVNQAQDRLPVDVRDEVTGAQPRLLRRTALLHALQTQYKGSGTPSCTGRPLWNPSLVLLSQGLSFP